ncbi:MAG: hypothetical protein R3220_13430, partial [Balneolaceae bacterium]|nr:hypothetical protein [Balneolaceae bacterium]
YYRVKNLISYIVLFLMAVIPVLGEAQSNISVDIEEEYYHRILQISGLSDINYSFNLRPYNYDFSVENDHPWQHVFGNRSQENRASGINFYSPILFQSYNTTLPRGNNDGAVWQGKGYNAAFSTGFLLSKGPFNLQFRPVFTFSQNRDFFLGPYEPPIIRDYGMASEFAYRDFRGAIDFVQRYGDQAYFRTFLGESFVDIRYKGIRLAFTNEMHWSGPGVNTSLQFGYSAPGFKHIYLGTYEPLHTLAGTFEFGYIFGGMKESEYFDSNEDNNLQSVNSLTFSYTPWFSDHFSIGFVRTFFHHFPESFSEYRFQASKLFEAVTRKGLSTEDNPTGQSSDNQMANIFLRYFIPGSGFEVYTEFGRNDHNANWRDFRAHPDHQRAYTIGLIKSFQMSENRLLALHFELNQMETNRTSLTRGNKHLGGWFTHGNQIQGFTNMGQIPGTGFGPGMNMQMLKGDLYDENGRFSLKMARIVYHNSRLDQYFRFIEAANSEPIERWQVRNVEFMIGAEKTFFLSHGIELSTAIEQSVILNHHYLKNNDLLNTRFEIRVRKRIQGWLR